jgi:hypothetical protein
MTMLRLTVAADARDLDLDSFLLSEADELKRLTGWSRQEWLTALFDDHPDAIRFAWMVANRRAGSPLPGAFKDIDFDLGSFQVDVVADEPEETVEGAEGESVPTGPPAE